MGLLKSRGVSLLILMDVRVVCVSGSENYEQAVVWLAWAACRTRINRFFTTAKSNCTISV